MKTRRTFKNGEYTFCIIVCKGIFSEDGQQVYRVENTDYANVVCYDVMNSFHSEMFMYPGMDEFEDLVTEKFDKHLLDEAERLHYDEMVHDSRIFARLMEMLEKHGFKEVD